MNRSINTQTIALTDEFQSEVNSRLQKMTEENWVDRIWDGDAGLWASGSEHIEVIGKSLGWLHLPERMMPQLEMLREFAEDARSEFDRVVLLGMGGSSLAPWCFWEVCGQKDGYPELHLLDSTVPSEVIAATDGVDLERCLFIVASKSGTTIETLSFFEYFWAQMLEIKGDDAGENFVIISDPGSPLIDAANEREVRAVFENWEDIGGRYSALSYFGMVPAALIGAPIEGMIESAREMAAACAPGVPVNENPGAALGAFLGTCHEFGRDKLTLLTSPPLWSFGDWVEQLLAESTGKQGMGIVPVVGECPLEATAYGDDRLFAYLHYGDDRTHDRMTTESAESALPLVTIAVDEPCMLGAEMFRWEFATAVAGAIMRINPFDQPNVQEAKDKTREVLDHYEETGELPDQGDEVVEGSLMHGNVRGAVKHLIDSIGPGDYFAIMAYLPRTDVVDEAIAKMRTEVAHSTGVATTAGYGPRFLHSTGQLHKGGPTSGVFLQITAEGGEQVEIPGAAYDFATLKDGQAAGDLAALQSRERRVIRVDLGDNIAGNLGRLTEMIVEAV